MKIIFVRREWRPIQSCLRPQADPVAGRYGAVCVVTRAGLLVAGPRVKRTWWHGQSRYALDTAVRGRHSRTMASSEVWDQDTADRYDADSSEMFSADVLDPAVDFLAALAGDGPALECHLSN